MRDTLKEIFYGYYNFTREVNVPRISARGEGKFSLLEADLISYQERGEYTLDNRLYTFSQQYYFFISLQNLFILKKDKKIMHSFSYEEEWSLPLRLSHVHYCGCDTYQVELNLNLSSFAMNYMVKGGKKDYTTHTRFLR